MANKDSHNETEGQQKKSGARRIIDHARGQWEDAERRIRAAMRIHPRPKTAKTSLTVEPEPIRTNSPDPELDKQMSRARAKSPYVPEPDPEKKDVA
jgi:hypothetical protein